MIFVVVKVKVREGQNFEFQIKNPNEKKIHLKMAAWWYLYSKI